MTKQKPKPVQAVAPKRKKMNPKKRAKAPSRAMVRIEAPPPSIPWSPHGIVLALQYWTGDEKRAFELARLIADLESVRRQDVALFFCCDDETVQSQALLDTQQYCGNKFYTGVFQSGEAGHGYPAGPNALWANCMKFFYRQWCAGVLRFESVFTMESDSAPLRRDWISQIINAHRETLDSGMLITGAHLKNHYTPHVNGNLVAHVSIVRNFPELLETPPAVAWDIHHRVTLRRLTRPDHVIRSEHRSVKWSKESLTSMATETAWLHGVIDNSGLQFAKSLLPQAAERQGR